jgi:DNA ligase-1
MSKMQKPMKGDDVELAKVVWPKMVFPKYDGYRAYNDGIGVLHTSSGKPVTNEHTQNLFKSTMFNGFDGELIVGAPNLHETYTNTSGPVRKKTGEPDVRWYVFDDRSIPNTPYSDRLAALSKRVKQLQLDGFPGADKIIVAPCYYADDEQAYGVIRDHIIGAGYEGTILRDPNGPYKFGRSTVNEGFMMKDKPWQDAEATIIGFERRRVNHNEAEKDLYGNTTRSTAKDGMVEIDMIGKFLATSPKWPGEILKIATGPLKHEDLKAGFHMFDSVWIGKMIVFRFLPSGGYELPRHPQFKGERGAEDLS